MKKKLMVIGLDCATPQLVFEEWRNELPNLKKMIDGGSYGKLLSTDPPITVPAWTSMLTGKDPGTLGIYGFRNRKNYTYDQLFFANNLVVSDDRVWDILSKEGKRSIIIGVPQTYPPKPLNGLLAASFLTPDKSARFTYPDSFKHRLDDLAGGYIIDVDNFRTNKKEELLDAIYEMTNRRFQAVTSLAKDDVWDFFMFVEMGIDRIHHAFWRFMDKSHRLYEPGNRYESVIKDYYIYLDNLIGVLLDKLEPNTAVMVVSDHGAKTMIGGIAINDWLISKGYMTLKEKPDRIKPLKPDMIDWENTVAWGEGGYYSRVFMNVRGREPMGKVNSDDYEKVRDQLVSEFEGICDEEGRNIGTKALKPENLYHSVKNVAPDLIVYLGNLDWRSIGSVGYEKFHVYENDTGPDDANHDYHGIFIYNEDISVKSKGRELPGLCIYDVASTILDYFDIDPPMDMIGKIISKEYGEI